MGVRLPEVPEIPEIQQKWKNFLVLCNMYGSIEYQLFSFLPQDKSNKHAFYIHSFNYEIKGIKDEESQ